MAKSRRLVPGVALLVCGALVGCGTPDRGDGRTAGADDQTTRTSSALTTILFQPYVAYATGSWPEAVAIGDLDGDSRNDIALLTSSHSDPTNDFMVHVFLQNTDGTLKPRVKYSVGARGSSIDIGDVNGDGRADVVVGLGDTTGGVQIGVLLQNAAGTLDPMVSYPTVNSYRVKVGDFNGDGRTDVAGLNSGLKGDGLDVLLQTEAGVLAAPVTYHVPHGGQEELDADDIDGDGRTDLVVMSGQGSSPNVNVLLQTADGLLGTPTAYSVGPGVVAAGVALGDTNGDGREDIVLSYGGNRPNSFIARLTQNPQGSMDPAVSYASYDIPSAIVLADVDGDGRKDALVTHSGWSRLGVYRQFPSGDFVSEEPYTIPYATVYQPQGLAVGDINGDGRPDAVIADYNHGLIVLRHLNQTSVGLAMSAPVDGTYYTGTPLTARWAAGDTSPLTGFDLTISVNNGTTYTAVPGCTGLPATVHECTWTPTSPSSNAARLRVTARDGTGQTVFAETTFTLVTPMVSPFLSGSTQYVGTTTTITWIHNLPQNNTVRVELSRDGGASFETLAASVPLSAAGSTTANTFSWSVTGPASTTAKVRVTTNSSPTVIGTTANFAIVTPTVTVTGPAAGTSAYTTALSIGWTTNVSGASTVRIELSRDGGATFQTIAASATNSGTFSASVSGPDAIDARVRVTTNGSVTATGTSASFTLLQPSVAVTTPVAGSLLYAGMPLAISWSSNLPAASPVRVELSRNGGGSYETLAASAPNTGAFLAVATGPDTSAALVRLTVTGPGTTSATSGAFAIVTPSLTVTGPAPGAAFYAGTPAAITWTTNLPATSPALVEVSRDGGATFETVAAAAPNTGNFAWIVTAPDSAAVVARVTVTDPIMTSGTSGAFSVVTPSLTVTGPSAGAQFYAGTPVTITWSDNLPATDPVSIELSRDGGATFAELATVANTGSFVWTASGPDTAQASVRITSGGAASASNVGPSFAIVVPTVAVTSPAGGESWAIGTARTISWTSNLPAGTTVAVALSRDGGATWTTLASSAAATGSLAWTATAPATSAALVRVSANGSIPAVGTSGAFAIGNPAVAVTSPAAGASWTIGTAHTITWTSNLLPSATVKIQISRNGGSTYTTLTTSTPNTGSYAWTTTGGATTTAIVKVTANGFSATALSGTFSVVAASVTVTAPNAAVTWAIGSVQTITWTHNVGADAQFQIEVSRAGVWSTIAPSVPGGGATTGSYQWTVTGPKATNAKVRVTWTGGTAKDVSDVAFKIN